MTTVRKRPLAPSARRTRVATAKTAFKDTLPAPVADLSVQIRQLRERIGFTQVEFAPLLDVSLRTLASMEAGKKTIGQPRTKAFSELKRLVSRLSEVMPASEVGQWLKTPNSAFGGFKPLELVDRGEADRIFEMIYVLRAGIPG